MRRMRPRGQAGKRVDAHLVRGHVSLGVVYADAPTRCDKYADAMQMPRMATRDTSRVGSACAGAIDSGAVHNCLRRLFETYRRRSLGALGAANMARLARTSSALGRSAIPVRGLPQLHGLRRMRTCAVKQRHDSEHEAPPSQRPTCTDAPRGVLVGRQCPPWRIGEWRGLGVACGEWSVGPISDDMHRHLVWVWSRDMCRARLSVPPRANRVE